MLSASSELFGRPSSFRFEYYTYLLIIYTPLPSIYTAFFAREPLSAGFYIVYIVSGRRLWLWWLNGCLRNAASRNTNKSTIQQHARSLYVARHTRVNSRSIYVYSRSWCVIFISERIFVYLWIKQTIRAQTNKRSSSGSRALISRRRCGDSYNIRRFSDGAKPKTDARGFAASDFVCWYACFHTYLGISLST